MGIITLSSELNWNHTVIMDLTTNSKIVKKLPVCLPKALLITILLVLKEALTRTLACMEMTSVIAQKMSMKTALRKKKKQLTQTMTSILMMKKNSNIREYIKAKAEDKDKNLMEEHKDKTKVNTKATRTDLTLRIIIATDHVSLILLFNILEN